MTAAEKIELALIPIAGIGFWLMAPLLPDNVSAGRLLLWTSAFLLLQSLVRDLSLLAGAKRAAAQGVRRQAQCICIESTVGATGIVAGAVLMGVGIDRPVVMDNWIWSPLAMATMAVGFAIKDYIVEWRPWRVRRDKDHMNIVFTWKK